jgi:hypothetical protein
MVTAAVRRLRRQHPDAAFGKSARECITSPAAATISSR